MAAIVARLCYDGSRGLADVTARLCAQVMGMSGIAVSVLAIGGVGELVWRTEGVSVGLDDLQFTLGAGPSQDAGHRVSLCWSRTWPPCRCSGGRCSHRLPLSWMCGQCSLSRCRSARSALACCWHTVTGPAR